MIIELFIETTKSYIYLNFKIYETYYIKEQTAQQKQLKKNHKENKK